MFETYKYVDQLTVAHELGVHRVTAQRWIDAASTILPIVECDKRVLGKRGFPVRVYRLIKDD